MFESGPAVDHPGTGATGLIDGAYFGDPLGFGVAGGFAAGLLAHLLLWLLAIAFLRRLGLT